MRNFLFFISLLIFFFAEKGFSQSFGCYDSLMVTPGAPCYPDYEPVCACNGTTYKNYCFARAEGYMIYTDGICEALDMNIRINPVWFQLDATIFLRNEADLYLWIIDTFGKVYFQKFSSYVKREILLLDVNHYDPGLYIIIASNGNEFITRKFIKVAR